MKPIISKHIILAIYLILTPLFCFAEGQSGILMILAIATLIPTAIISTIIGYIIFKINSNKNNPPIKNLSLKIGLVAFIVWLIILGNMNII